MTTKTRKKPKPRKCSLSEDEIKELAEMMKKRFFSYGELSKILIEKYGYKREVFNLLSYLEARGYLIAQETRTSKYGGSKNYFMVMTKEVYEKIAEEHRKNATRRLLAAVSN